MRRKIEVICPNCNSLIYIYNKEYNKETECYCRNCKNDYRIILNDTGDILEKIESIEKKCIVTKITKMNYIGISAIILCFIFGFIYLFLQSIPINNSNSSNIIDNVTERNDEIDFLVNIDDMSEDFLTIIDDASEGRIFVDSSFVERIFDSENGFDVIFKRKKFYLLNKSDNNLLITVYLCTYSNKTKTYNVYTPIVYEKATFNYSTHQMNFIYPPSIVDTTPKVYFDDDKTQYTVGYLSLEDLYETLVSPLEDEYKVSEKNY